MAHIESPTLRLDHDTHDNETFLLLYLDQTLVGYLEAIDCGHELWVMEIGVHPGHRGRRYATRLLRNLLDNHPETQIALSASSFAPNHVWRRAPVGLPYNDLSAWYERHGFRPDGDDEDSSHMTRLP